MSFTAALAALGEAGAAVGSALGIGGGGGAAAGGVAGSSGLSGAIGSAITPAFESGAAGAAGASGAGAGGISGAASSFLTPEFASGAATGGGGSSILPAFAQGADALGTAGGFEGMGGAASPTMLQQGMDLYQKANSMSNNHPNSGMVGQNSQPGAQQQNQNPLFQQMMGMSSQQQPERKQLETPWAARAGDMVTRREPTQQQMQLGQLMQILGQGQTPLHSLEDTGGSGAGGTSGGLVKNVLSLIGK